MERLIDKLGRSSGRREEAAAASPSGPDPAATFASASSTASGHADPASDSGTSDLFGLFQLWPPGQHPGDTQLDIVAVHGLNGTPYKTWTQGDQLWLADFLPVDVPRARIFTYGYNSGVAFTGSTSRVDDYARTLLERLVAKRRSFANEEKRPLIFICHSLGGIVVKKALVIAHERSSRYHSITRDTYGIMFFGTPHRGSDTAFWGKLFGNLADVLTLGSVRTQLLDDLRRKSDVLGATCFQFVERAQSLGRIFSVYERLRIKGLSALVVEEDSAVMGISNEIPIPIEADHRSMCRFSNMKTEEYQMVADCIKEMVEDALEDVVTEEPTPVRDDFVRCLKTVDPDDMLRNVPRPSTGTCLWVTDTDAFKNWRNNQSTRLLWISGLPGVGKTTTTRFLIEHLRRWLQRNTASSGTESIVAFFFCSSKQWLRNSEEHVAKSLLYQILSQNTQFFRYLNSSDMKSYVASSRNLPGDADTLGDLEATWRLLTIMLQRSPSFTFWILIDAIDELPDPSRSALLRRIQTLIAQDLGGKLKFVLCDRNKPPGGGAVASSNAMSWLEINGRDKVADDVRHFINERLEDLCSRGEIPWQYHNTIEESLMEASEGNFLQATLAWNHFRGGVSYWSPQVIKSRLDGLRRLSGEAKAFYCSLLARIPEDSHFLAKMGFTWVLGSRKPLTLTELQHAVSISTGQRSWSDLTDSLGFNFDSRFEQAFGYLLRVDPDSCVRFAHSTVKELLTAQVSSDEVASGEPTVLSRFVIREADINAQLAKSCIIVLSFRDFVKLRDIAREAMADRMKDMFLTALQTEEALRSLNFAKYDDPDSVHAEDQDVSERIGQAMQKLGQTGLDQRTRSLFAYCVSYWNYHCSHGSTDPEVIGSLTRFALLRQSHYFLMVATLLGMARYHQGRFWDEIDQFSRLPALHFVLKTGDHPRVLQNLINQGQNINGADCNGWTPLVWALLEGRRDSLELLLACDETRLHRCDLSGSHALHLALEAHIDTDLILRLLADPRVDVNAKHPGPHRWTALQWCLSASRSLQQVTDELLRRKDVEIYQRDRFGHNAIEQIFHEGISEKAAMAIIARSDVPHNWFEKPLGRVAAEIALVTARGGPSADSSSKDSTASECPSSYLYRVASLGWDEVEDVIIARCPSKAIVADQDGLSLLERYAYHGVKQRLVRVLSRLPTYVFGMSKDWGVKLLIYCTQQDWEDVTVFLIHRFPADDDPWQDADGRTELHWACELHWKSLPSLISTKSKAWLDKRSNAGRTALHEAAEFRNELACVALLQAGADSHIRDKAGKLPIHLAAEQGHRSIVSVLLQGAIRDIGTRGLDMDGRSILHYLAMWQTDTFIRQCLPSLRPKVDLRDAKGRSAMHFAAMFGNRHALSILLDIGADPNLRDHSSLTPLHHALMAGSTSCAQMLLERGARYDCVDMFQRNVVLLAVLSENNGTVEYVARFLRSKLQPRELKRYASHTDSFGRSALHYLCHWRARPQWQVDELLLEEVDDQDDARVDEGDEDEPSLQIELSTPVEWMIKTFVALGADVNGQDDKKHQTPLHTAALMGALAAAKSLLRAPGINPSVKDADSYTPMDWASRNGHTSVCDAIGSRGGEQFVDWGARSSPTLGAWQAEFEKVDEIAPCGDLARRA